MPNKTHAATGSVVKQGDYTDELKALAGDDSDLCAYATVEAEDRDKDIVRVAGVSLKNHRAESPIKLFASHLRSLPNGESPVVGRVLKFAQVTHKGTGKPALAFAAKFAQTPLGKHYKSLYESGDMTDFSIGFRPVKAEPLGKDKGYDFVESELMEVSCVALPANEHASVMRAYEETYPSTENEIARLLGDLVAMAKSGNAIACHSLCDLMIAKRDAIESGDSEGAPLGAHLIALNKNLETILTRLDDLEDTFYAGQSKECADSTAGHTEAAKSEEVSATADLTSLAEAIERFRSHLNK
jgi:HK97 family phage prohead protease